MSVPAASARMRKMEEALGRQLFYRTGQGLAPTSAGHAVLRHALAILRQVEQLTGELRENAGGMSGNIRLYANTLSISDFIPPALQTFLLKFPGVNIDLHECSSTDIARALKQGAADIGILSADVPGDGLDCVPYRTERLVLITPRGHPLADGGPVDFAQTLKVDYIGLKENMALQSFIMRAASREGAAMKLRIQVNNFEALCGLVDSGVGVAIIPESVARRHAKHLGIAIVGLLDDWAVRDLKIAARDLQSLAAPAKALIDVLVAPAV
jgi:DNA-binding transcriptional LysR family regulator